MFFAGVSLAFRARAGRMAVWRKSKLVNQEIAFHDAPIVLVNVLESANSSRVRGFDNKEEEYETAPRCVDAAESSTSQAAQKKKNPLLKPPTKSFSSC